MNKNLLCINGALLAGALCAWSALTTAQESIVTTTTTNGTITQFAPSDSLFIRTEPDAAPLRYAVTKETTVVDETGTPVVVEKITPGLPVVVHYTRAGDRLVASRIVLRKAPPVTERTTTTTTTTVPGTIAQFIPGATLVLRTGTSPDPVPYVVTKQTTFVDENGTPVVAENITPGVPVNVQYVREGDRILATRVVVRAISLTPPPPPRILTHDEKERLEKQIEKRTKEEKERLEKQEKQLKKQLKRD
jgi:hypothetical protein